MAATGRTYIFDGERLRSLESSPQERVRICSTTTLTIEYKLTHLPRYYRSYFQREFLNNPRCSDRVKIIYRQALGLPLYSAFPKPQKSLTITDQELN